MFEEIPEGGFQTERLWWRYFHNREKGAARMGEMDEWCERAYGHIDATRVRVTACLLADHFRGGERRSGMDEVMYKHMCANSPDAPHPDALELLAEYGQWYTPIGHRAPRREPRRGHCYQNAHGYMAVMNGRHPGDVPLVYVEGLAFGTTSPLVLHGWNARGLEGGRAIDFTCYATARWHRYLGVPLAEAELTELRAELGEPGCLFAMRTYQPRTGEYIRARRVRRASIT